MSRVEGNDDVTRALLLGLGTALPTESVKQAEAVRMAALRCCETPAQERLLKALYRLTRVHERGSVVLQGQASEGGGTAVEADAMRFFPPPVASTNGDSNGTARGPGTAERMEAYARLAPPLAERASRAAMRDAGIDGEGVTHLVTVSCTGFRAPGVDLALVNRLNLPRSVQRVNVGFMGCHGAMNGLATARALARSDPNARVLLCCVELCSLHFQYGWDEQQLVANALFADGAAAAVIGQGTAADEAVRGDDGTWQIVDTASCLLPDSDEQMTWQIDDHGFVMTLSPQVPGTLIKHVQPWIERWLGDLGLAVEDVDGWAVHPGGPRILDATQQALRLDGEALACSKKMLREHGNMSSPTVLFILEQLERELPQPDGYCVVLSFGPGLTGEAALLRRGRGAK